MTQPSPVRSVMFNVLLFRCHCSNQSGSNCNNDFALLYARLGRTRSSLSHVAPKLPEILRIKWFKKVLNCSRNFLQRTLVLRWHRIFSNFIGLTLKRLDRPLFYTCRRSN